MLCASEKLKFESEKLFLFLLCKNFINFTLYTLHFTLAKHSVLCATPFDLHVLSTPPAFVLSQDQTLHKIYLSLQLSLEVQIFYFEPFGSLTFFEFWPSKGSFTRNWFGLWPNNLHIFRILNYELWIMNCELLFGLAFLAFSLFSSQRPCVVARLPLYHLVRAVSTVFFASFKKKIF